MTKSLYTFTGHDASFRVEGGNAFGPVYFPLANEMGLLSAITPDLNGDIKMDQHTFLTPPVSFEDLHLSRAARNFWLTPTGRSSGRPWSVTGNSVWQKSSSDEQLVVDAGLLWHLTTRTNKKLGVEARVLSFVPPTAGTFEVMFVEIKNISSKKQEWTATSAIPLYGRSADNLRDHRHVTSLLHRLTIEKFGIRLCPTMSFNERGHLVNNTAYYVLGVDEQGRAPKGFFPTVEQFVGDGGSLDRPVSLMKGAHPSQKKNPTDDGKEAMGGLQFAPFALKPGASWCFTLLLGIDKSGTSAKIPLPNFTGRKKITAEWEKTKKYWTKKTFRLKFSSGNTAFDQWIPWVQLQPSLRKIYGCSFLPDFDYGRGGRGWRDLWQDCLALLLANPDDVREDLVRNYGGVRVDGSNATIIGRTKGPGGKWIPEFIADRNNIVRTWMDHGVWPFLTTLLYIHQTGDWSMLLEKVPYFRDAFLFRGQKVDEDWRRGSDKRTQMKSRDGKIYQGTVLEHILIQTLVPFFHVGTHNIIRLEDADWNDGLDMAKERGESVAFTAMYAGNMVALAALLEAAASRAGWRDVVVAQEILELVDQGPVGDYDSVAKKQKRVEWYFEDVAKGFSGRTMTVPIATIVRDLRRKAEWITHHLNTKEWVEARGQSWFNGYYDNMGHRVEGANGHHIRMTLAGQVYPVMAGVAPSERVRRVIKAVNAHLWDKNLGGVRLNTNFGAIQPNLGRAFSFAFGEKENGAIFSHMAVMYSYALYKRGFVNEGHRVLGGLFQMATNSARSRIFPGLPEYFNNEGRGRYAYLTGSASWYVLTLLTQAYGVRGEWGDLLLAPKLVPSQFDGQGQASVQVTFAGRPVTVIYHNPKKLAYEKIKIKNIKTETGPVVFTRMSDKEAVIGRAWIVRQKSVRLHVELGEVK